MLKDFIPRQIIMVLMLKDNILKQLELMGMVKDIRLKQLEIMLMQKAEKQTLKGLPHIVKGLIPMLLGKVRMQKVLDIH